MPAPLPLKVLILEDQPADAELMLDELRQSGFDPDWQRVRTRAEYLAGLNATLDVILADHKLPQFDGLTALTLLHEQGLDIPFILVSGSIGEELAVSAMKQGAADYLLKDRLTRLGAAVTNALEARRLRGQQRQAEALLRESEVRYRTLVEQASDGIFIANSEGRYIQVNSAGCLLLGYTREEILEKTIRDLTRTDPNQPLRLEELRQGNALISNREMIRKDGTLVPVEISAKQLSDGSFQGIVRDITERRRAEETLARERVLMRTLIDSLPDRIYAKDAEGRFTLKNEADARQMGAASTHEVIGKTDFDYYPSEMAAQYHNDDQIVIQSGQPLFNREEAFTDSDGNSGWMLTTKVPLRDAQGKVIGLVGTGRDITILKQAETNLRRLNRTLALLSEVNQAIVRIRSTNQLFEKICRIAVEIGGFRMAWIGLLDAETRRVNPVAHAGITEDYLEKIGIVLSDEPRGHGPTASALRSGEHTIANDVVHDAHMTPWREDALRLGYGASAAFPLKVGNEVRGLFALYADVPEFFDDNELKLLDEMADDISFALAFAEQEAQRQQAETALKQHAQAVEEMRLFLQTTLDAFPANTVVLAPDGTIIDMNASWIHFANENSAPSAMHYLGTNYLRVCDRASGPRSEEAAPASSGILAVTGGSLNEFYLEYPCHSPSEKRWFALQVTPFPEAVPRRVVVAHINITERKQAEEHLQNAHDLLERRVIERTAELQTAKERVESILSNSADAILLTHRDFSIQQTNASFNNMFDCEQDEYFGKPLNVLLHSNNGAILDWMIQASPDQSKLVVDVEAQRKDGTIFAAELSIGFIKNDSFVCTFHDISARKQVEQSLRIAVEKEKELNELKTRFVSMASHEFRTPLATIYAIIETLSTYRHRLTENQIEQKLSNIRIQMGYLKDIMDDVLKLAQLQARRFEFNPESTDLDTLCQQVIADFQSQQDINHSLIYTCENAIPTTQLDKKLIRQLIANLLSNAIKYSPEDKTIRVKLECTGDMLMLRVQDTGIGISEADLTHLFEPFHRGTNVGTIHGTGLGLVIAREAVDLHGGTITVASQVGTGTTFTVRIPIVTQEKRAYDKNSTD